MFHLYETTSNSGLLLYTSNQRILLRTKNAEQFNRPTLLSSDYQSNLSDVAWSETIYYAYINTDNQVVIKCIASPYPLFTTSHFESVNDAPKSYSHPQVITFQNQLILFYLEENSSKQSFTLKCIFPFHCDSAPVLAKELSDATTLTSYSRLPEIYLLSTSYAIYFQLILSYEGSHKCVQFLVDKNYHIHELSVQNNSTQELSVQGNSTQDLSVQSNSTQDLSVQSNSTQDLSAQGSSDSQDDNQKSADLEAALTEVTIKNEQLIAELSEANCQNAKLSASLEEVNDRNTHLETEISSSALEIARLNAIIQSATKQYNELMSVANSYRDEAIKWRSKFTL